MICREPLDLAGVSYSGRRQQVLFKLGIVRTCLTSIYGLPLKYGHVQYLQMDKTGARGQRSVYYIPSCVTYSLDTQAMSLK